MTQSIELAQVRATGANAATPAEAVRHRRALAAVKVLSPLAATGSLVCFISSLTSEKFGFHLIAASATLVILGGIGGALLVLQALLTSRQAYYRRGMLDGWMRGWNGQPPEANVPGFQ